MKKIILFIILFTPIAVFANTYDQSFCPQPPYPISKKFIQGMDKATGMNFLTTKTVETVLKNQLKKDFGGSYKVDIQSFSASNLARGKFKNLSIDGENLIADGIRISNFSAKSMCEFSHIQIQNENVKFAQNMLVNFEVKMSEADLKNSVSSKFLNGISYPQNGVPMFKFDVSDVSIEGNYLTFTISYLNFFKNRQSNFKFRASLEVQNGKIVFTDVGIVNSNLNFTRIMPLINLFNPFVSKINVLDNKDSVLRVNSVKIKDKQILIDGKVYIPKNI